MQRGNAGFHSRCVRWIHALGLTLLLMAASSPASAANEDFVRMFPHLPAFEPPDVALANHGALVLSNGNPGPMVDTLSLTDNSPSGTPAAFTYFGQFVDHDVTRDENPLPDTTFPIELLDNVRNAKLDLDSVYGPGSVRDPDNPDKMLIGPDG